MSVYLLLQKMDYLISSSLTAVDLPAELFDAINSVFISLGVDKVSDVRYVGEADLTGIVKPVHARKLIAYWGTLRYVNVIGITSN